MAEGQRPGNDSLLDMEKELTCSVSAELMNGWGHTHQRDIDLYRHPLSASDSPRLSTHLLRIMLERVVRLASCIHSAHKPAQRPSIHLPLM